MNGEKSKKPIQKRGNVRLGQAIVSSTETDPRKKGKEHGGEEESNVKPTGGITGGVEDAGSMISDKEKGTSANKDSDTVASTTRKQNYGC
jgi:hypothetical protein